MFSRLKKTLETTKLLKTAHPNLRPMLVKTNEQLSKAKQLHASVYLANGYIEKSHVNNKGHITLAQDPYQEHSQYFVVAERGTGEVVATARQIGVSGRKGHLSFPTLKHIEIDEQVRQALGALDPKNCVEISALAKKKGYTSYASFMIYRALWQHSLRSRHQVWLMACDARVYKHLKFLFADALTQVGKETIYMGSTVVPAVLEVDRSLDVVIGRSRSINPALRALHKELIRFFLAGLPAKYLKPRQLTELHLTSSVKA
jgi:hypothetical protein